MLADRRLTDPYPYRIPPLNIYVGNLSFNTSEQELHDAFAKHGAVTSAKIITDRDTGRSRGFGFVEMSQGDAQQAIAKLNGHSVDSRELRVNEAQAKPRR